ncbi:hypothetical protein E5P55_00250 [Candidatus Pinguicoccus supinus]|uniref:Uncharacterized protein n=1 Tax=Candidatus Pinguicoccus supinus TaxID=2529394 RepID=A0A7T0BRC5_9BACT|nr:hypothetical protein E5P55_00250 [Candidatus Pinguicoccus supinus]
MYNNLSTFNRRDSQGLCFLKNIKFVDFLKIYLNSYLSTIHLFKFYKLKLSFIKDLNYFPVGFKINTLFLRFKDLKLGFCRFYSSYYSYKKIIYIHTINMQLYFQKKRAYFLSGKFRSFRDFLRIKLFLNGFRTGYFFLKKKIKPLLNSGQVLALYKNNRLVGGGIFF